MLTYVINTSENRTLDSDRLFDLAGYTKIKWMNCPLNEVGQCAQQIFEKQNVLGADDFRIAVLVDFFGFDRVRVPYGRVGYLPETGVDISVYLPYIEVYLLDHLVAYLEKRELSPTDFEVYYIQNTKLEQFEFLDNAKSQLTQILSGGTVAQDYIPPVKTGKNAKDGSTEESAEKKETEEKKEPAVYYDSFSLYCNPNVSLTFSLTDYPYGATAMTFDEFFNAFTLRVGRIQGVRKHYYVSNYGGGPARAALDTLSLSLYLIRMYEREETRQNEGQIEVRRIDAEQLKDVLVTAWNKINIARAALKTGNVEYYSLKENLQVDDESMAPRTEATAQALSELSREELDSLGAERLYKRIVHYHGRSSMELAKERQTEYDNLIGSYLARRDETRECDVEAEFTQRMVNGSLVKTKQFPSKEEYLYIASTKRKEISERFKSFLQAAYQDMDFSEEKKAADQAYSDYLKVKKSLHRNIIFDIIFIVISLLVMALPYITLQTNTFLMTNTEAVMLVLQATAGFFGLFVLAAIILTVYLTHKMSKAKKTLKQLYRKCFQKECDSYAQIRKRYEEDLLDIERMRYELRQLEHLYQANMIKDSNIKRHSDLLEELDDRLGTILNKLDVEPILDQEDTISDEFDVSKPIRARENKIYRIFSLDTIDKLFEKRKEGEDAV